MKRGWLIVLLLSLGLNVGLGVHLLRPGPPPPPLPEPEQQEFHFDRNAAPDSARAESFLRRRLDRMTGELGLDEAQRTALWDLHRESGGAVLRHRSSMIAAREALHQAYGDPDMDLAAAHRAVRRIGDLQTELDSMVVEIIMREREILTPEQRLHYRSLIPLGPDQRSRYGRHGQRGEGRQGRGGGR